MMKEKEDRLSDLPDSLLHHIISFLPSTREAIQTGVLSKRWLRQWTCVRNLIFDFSNSTMISDISPKTISDYPSTISNFIDHTLLVHDCPKIQKFHIISMYYYDPASDPILLFAIRKQVEDLVLKFCVNRSIRLPDFFFRQACLVKLKLYRCSVVMPTGIVEWESLSDLCLSNCDTDDSSIICIISGSPLLQSLKIKYCDGLDKLLVSSKSLKRLVLVGVDRYVVDISCPNLVEFAVVAFTRRSRDFDWLNTVMGKLISESPSLESLKLKKCESRKLRIAFECLKKLALICVFFGVIEISCPRLEDLDLCGYCCETLRLTSLPSSVRAALDLHFFKDEAKTVLEQLQHINQLKFGRFFIQTSLDQSYPLLNCKSLTLEASTFERIVRFVCAVHTSPVLERLVVRLLPDMQRNRTNLSNLDHSEENYWNYYGSHYSIFVSHLRTLKITGFSRRENRPKFVLDFVEYLSKKASKLEKITVVVSEDRGSDFATIVSQKLLSIPQSSFDVMVELLYSCSGAHQ